MVRIVFERGGGKEYFILNHIEDIRQFCPKEIGIAVVNELLTAWAECLLVPPDDDDAALPNWAKRRPQINQQWVK